MRARHTNRSILSREILLCTSDATPPIRDVRSCELLLGVATIFVREKGWAKENFTMVAGGSLCVL